MLSCDETRHPVASVWRILGGPALRPPPCVRCGLPPSLALHAHESDEEEVQAQEGGQEGAPCKSFNIKIVQNKIHVSQFFS